MTTSHVRFYSLHMCLQVLIILIPTKSPTKINKSVYGNVLRLLLLHCLVYLPEEDATVFAKVQRVAVLLLHGVVFLQGEIHQLPVHIVIPGYG